VIGKNSVFDLTLNLYEAGLIQRRGWGRKVEEGKKTGSVAKPTAADRREVSTAVWTLKK
jgi:hypothetical protein